MPTSLNIFPARVPIGRAFDATGRAFDVLMTPEFSRALADLMQRVGGGNNFSNDELAAMIATDPSDGAALATLQRMVVDLMNQLAAASSTAARLAALERKFADLAVLANSTAPVPVDWEHPGKIGAGTANSGKFTTLEGIGQVNLHPKDKAVDLKPTGSSLMTIQPEQPGQIDNMEIGKTTPRPARVLTLNKLTFTQPATAATYTLADGKAFTVSNTLTLTANDGATLNVGAGGTLGSAAYSSSGAFAARSNTALAPAATDPTSTQALANSIRAVLLSVGIGT